jgi:hypothetical protein
MTRLSSSIFCRASWPSAPCCNPNCKFRYHHYLLSSSSSPFL